MHLRPVPLCLCSEEPGVDTASGDERIMVPVLDNPAAFEHQNPVGQSGRAQPMRNHDRGAAGSQFRKALELGQFSQGVEDRCRLVQHREVGMPQESPGEGDALPLSARELRLAELAPQVGTDGSPVNA